MIFLGEVQSINPAKPAELPAGLSGSISVERDTTVFNVHKIWKVDARLSDNIALIAQRTDCTYWFKAGSSYLVYAYGPDEDGYYSTNKCSLTTTVENADEQIEILNALISAKAGQSSDDYFGYGCGGGIAARYPKTTIYRDGRLYSSTKSWTGADNNSEKDLSSDPVLAKEIFERLSQIDLDLINGVHEPAPYHCYFRAKLAGTEYRATWGGGKTDIPAELEDIGRLLLGNN